MITVNARGTRGAFQPFESMRIQRRTLRPKDVLIDIAYVGICHTDIHYARDEFGRTTFPLVPGHEIAGIVSAVGSEVTKFKVGDRAGIGCYADSCRVCEACTDGLEQYCSGHRVNTYNGIGHDGVLTQGGYSEKIVSDEHFAVKIPEAIPLQNAAPMFCAGITV